ncbi:MAG TPA: PfkB family carbohydrate kinase [Verrucomicrobiales bacterium]|nr:PfkB family carbohydrate kinase [Verrucomicrobiales bacterium]
MSLQIAGGTYLEVCQLPEWDEVFGSGLRAAVATAALGGDVHLSTYVSSEHQPQLAARSHGAGFSFDSIQIPDTVSFEYTHGFSTPHISPPPHFLRAHQQTPVRVTGECVLRFGFIEGDAIVSGGRVVYDPQNPHSPEGFADNGSTARQLAVVCNRGEGSRLTGEYEPQKIARALVGKNNCEAAVVKCGSLGSYVCDGASVEHVPAYETDSVWPIGSGDVYAAVFALKWTAGSMPASEAAEVASKATAFYCESKSLAFPPDFPAPFRNRPLKWSDSPDRRKRVYLAGPFFSMSQIWLINEARAALSGQGLEVFSPLHHVGRGPAALVYEPDTKGILEADVVFACVDGLDAGTLFEIGFAKANQKQVVVFVQNERSEDLKMLEGSRCSIQKDFVTAVYKCAWIARTS